jgi:translation initiation factor 3 subunit C
MATLKGRLWGGDDSSNESSSSDSESEDEKPQMQAADQGKKARVVWAEETSSDEEVTTKRKVVSHADKRFDQMKDAIKLMNNHQKVNDFAQIITDYESIMKMIDKMHNQISQDGGPPNFFIKACAGLELYCEKMHAEHVENKANNGQRLPKNKQTAFNTLRAKVRKGNAGPYQDQIEQCKEDPSLFKEAEQEDEDSASNSSDDSSASDNNSSSASGSDSDSDSDSNSDSDSSDSGSSGSDSSSDSDSLEENSFKSGTDSDSDDDEESAREKKMLRWLITPEQQGKRDEKERIKKESQVKDKEKKPRTAKQSSKAATDDKEVKTKEKEEFTPEQLKSKVQEIMQMRGRRQYVKKEYFEKLQLLEEHAVKQGPRAQLYILTAMISADFDNTGSLFEAMKIGLWLEAYDKVCKMLPLMIESHQNQQDGTGEIPEDEEDPRNHTRLQELWVSFVEKLDDELYKALQLTLDVYGSEYQEILANSSKFMILLKRVHRYFEDTKQLEPLGVISLRLMEQLYYKHDVLNSAVFESIAHQMPEDQKEEWVWPADSKVLMRNLARNVFPNGKPLRPRTEATDEADGAAPVQNRLHRRASLCQAYHLALHNHFHAARDLLQLGNLHENAMDSDIHTQILFNRVLAQMGLSAFRLGRIQEAHTFLMDVCMHNKARELLAQGLSYSKNMDRTPEQERAEKLRQLPYHMHVNLEVLESAHRICAMLLEVPNLAMQSIDPTNKRVISRVLRRALEDYEKKVFVGPPEDAKEAIVYAAKALQRGDWQTAVSSLEDTRIMKIWDHIDPANPENGQKIKATIKERIQTEALRTYLFAYASIYDAFHLDQLVSMFGLEPHLTHSIVSKMMIKEEITAFWDESSKYLLMQHSEPTHLQRLALHLSDRCAQAVDNNEKMVDNKSGGYGLANRQQGQQQQGAVAGGKGRFGKGGGMAPNDSKGSKGKGRGKGLATARPAQNRGWENARAGALRGNAQRGWATGTRS